MAVVMRVRGDTRNDMQLLGDYNYCGREVINTRHGCLSCCTNRKRDMGRVWYCGDARRPTGSK